MDGLITQVTPWRDWHAVLSHVLESMVRGYVVGRYLGDFGFIA